MEGAALEVLGRPGSRSDDRIQAGHLGGLVVIGLGLEVHSSARAFDQQVELERGLRTGRHREASFNLGLARPGVGPCIRDSSPGESFCHSEFGRRIHLTGVAQIADVSTFLVTLWSMSP
jgi:hypothetical protein